MNSLDFYRGLVGQIQEIPDVTGMRRLLLKEEVALPSVFELKSNQIFAGFKTTRFVFTPDNVVLIEIDPNAPFQMVTIWPFKDRQRRCLWCVR